MADITDKISDIAGKASDIAFGDGTIDAFKGVVSKHGGLAKNNKFNVIVTPPNVSLLNLNVTDITDNLLSGAFDIRQLLVDPRDISFLVTRAALPSWNISTFEYQTDKQVNKFPYSYIHEDLTISFLCTNDFYIKKMFDQWMNGVVDINSHTVNYKSNYTSDIVVSQLNEKGIPIYSYKFENSYPIMATAIEFEQGGTEFTKFDVTFAYDKFVPEGVISSAVSSVSNGFGKLAKAVPSNIASQTSALGNKIKSFF